MSAAAEHGSATDDPAPPGTEAEADTPTAGERDEELSLEHLTVARGGRPVVRDVSLRIRPGEVTALLGPNGAGKSSLVLAVGGVLPLESGSVELNGADLSGLRPEKIRAAGVAIVPEGRRLLSELSVEDNLRVATYSLPRGESEASIEYALELFPELQGRMGTRSRSLSGGEQQMLVLAQALVSKPTFVLIDELSLGLAPVVLKRLIPTIQKLADDGVGVLLIEQFATIALGMAKAAYVMGGGTIQFAGTADELKRKPDLLQSSYLTGAATINGGGAEK